MSEPVNPREDLAQAMANEDFTNLPVPAKQSAEAAAAQREARQRVEPVFGERYPYAGMGRAFDFVDQHAPGLSRAAPQQAMANATDEGIQFLHQHLSPLMLALQQFHTLLLFNPAELGDDHWQQLRTKLHLATMMGDHLARGSGFVTNTLPIESEVESDHGTSGGVALTDDLVEDLAAEAERGYPIERLRPRTHRPGGHLGAEERGPQQLPPASQ